jgi:hypothetical protein
MSEWVKCSERMPAYGDVVLVSGGQYLTNHVFAAVLEKTDKDGHWWRFANGGKEFDEQYKNPLFWMTLPDPPADGEKQV